MRKGILSGRFTLIQQWMAATVLAVIPLLVAVSYAAWTFQRQTLKQTEMVETLDFYTQSANGVAETVRELVRLTRQYQLLNDSNLLTLYGQKSESLDHHLTALRASLPPSHYNLLDEISSQSLELQALLTSPPMPDDDTLSSRLQSLASGAGKLSAAVNRHQHQTLQAGEREFNRIVDRLFYLSVLALPGTLLLMLLGTYAVSRPIWRLSQSIRTLGTRDWNTPIAIRGPSDLVALGDSLEWMRQQIVRSEQQKTAFIQHVTHELKTPLAAIIEAGNLLREEVSGPLEKGQRDILDILRGNARNLQGLIEQLLNYNAVSHGILTEQHPVALRPLCETIRRGLETATPGKGLAWTFEGNTDEVPADSRLVEMILKNLMGNAVQFSPPGGRIQVGWHLEDDHWQLSVADQGPGIEPDEIDRIFAPFYKGRTGRADKAPKNGIGLAIVSECVKLLNGRISTTSEVSTGTTFTLHFPIQRSTQRP